MNWVINNNKLLLAICIKKRERESPQTVMHTKIFISGRICLGIVLEEPRKNHLRR